MKNLVWSFILGVVLAIVASRLLAEKPKSVQPAQREHTEWVGKCLKDFQTIKPGMTRAEIEKRFPMDGGLQSLARVRFVHPESDSLKVDVEFEFKRNAGDQGRAAYSPDDKVTTVSKPYLELPFSD